MPKQNPPELDRPVRVTITLPSGVLDVVDRLNTLEAPWNRKLSVSTLRLIELGLKPAQTILKRKRN
jgi:hypothetical protein